MGIDPQNTLEHEKGRSQLRASLNSSGADRDRTDDLFHAMEALSQLSYGPNFPTDGLRWRLRKLQARGEGIRETPDRQTIA